MSEETRTDRELKVLIFEHLRDHSKKRRLNVKPGDFNPPIDLNTMRRVALALYEEDGVLKDKPYVALGGCVMRLSNDAIKAMESPEED